MRIVLKKAPKKLIYWPLNSTASFCSLNTSLTPAGFKSGWNVKSDKKMDEIVENTKMQCILQQKKETWKACTVQAAVTSSAAYFGLCHLPVGIPFTEHISVSHDILTQRYPIPSNYSTTVPYPSVDGSCCNGTIRENKVLVSLKGQPNCSPKEQKLIYFYN